MAANCICVYIFVFKVGIECMCFQSKSGINMYVREDINGKCCQLNPIYVFSNCLCIILVNCLRGQL